MAGGKGHVAKAFVNEVKTLRTRGDTCALIVVTDADDRTPQRVRQELDDKLREASVQPVSPSDRIGIFCPKYAIESWVYFLRGIAVDETAKQRKLDDVGSSRVEGKRLAKMCMKQEPMVPLPSSLVDACQIWHDFSKRCPKG